MSVRNQIPYNDGLCFITITCARFLKLFEILQGYDIVYSWFNHLKHKGHYITGYVLIPNHFHALIGFRNTGKSINSIVGNGKRFMAYELIERLNDSGQYEILKQLRSFVNATDRKRGKLHEPFEPSFDWKECIGAEFIEQKLDYMHGNPCQEHWKLVENPEEYTHSSARYYITGQQGYYPVTDYADLGDVDLTGQLGC